MTTRRQTDRHFDSQGPTVLRTGGPKMLRRKITNCSAQRSPTEKNQYSMEWFCSEEFKMYKTISEGKRGIAPPILVE